MWELIKGIGRRFSDFVAVRAMHYVHPPIANTGLVEGLRQVTQFSLDRGHWIIVAKAAAKGHGGNDGATDCRLLLGGTEGQNKRSDESYAAPLPLLGSSLMVMLPFQVTTLAQFRLEVGVQGAPAEFLHIKVAAFRDTARS